MNDKKAVGRKSISTKLRGTPKTGKRSLPRATKRKRRSASLAAPAAMGGIIGGGGYDFQTRFIACHIPEWLARNTFTQIFHEGTGDVDVEFGNSRSHDK